MKIKTGFVQDGLSTVRAELGLGFHLRAATLRPVQSDDERTLVGLKVSRNVQKKLAGSTIHSNGAVATGLKVAIGATTTATTSHTAAATATVATGCQRNQQEYKKETFSWLNPS